MRKLLRAARSRKLLSLIAVAALVFVGALFNRSGGKGSPSTTAVLRGNVVLEVSVTGKTKPVTAIELGFERGERIKRVTVGVGDRVTAGQTLAELDTAELAAERADAAARVAVERARLDELVSGTRPEDIRIKETELRKAEQDLENAYQSAFDVLNDSYVKADDAVRKQVDDLFTNDEETNPQLTFTVNDAQKEIDTEFRRQQAGTAINAWKRDLDELAGKPTDQDLIDGAVSRAKTYLLLIRSFLDKTMDAVLASNLSAATATSYKTSITTARTNVASALSNVSSQEQSISTLRITAAKISGELALKLAGARPEQIAAQRALLAQADAGARLIEAQFAKSVIRSPIDGVVTRQDAKPGEIAPLNTPLISVISDGDLEIEANVPEADFAKIAVGDPIRITLDAYGSTAEFRGRVTFIDPAETIVEGVPTYKVTSRFSEPDERIRPGITANLDILADSRANVLFIPQRTIGVRNGALFVLVLPEGAEEPEERTITTGLRGSEGTVEVTHGLTEGELILRSPE